MDVHCMRLPRTAELWQRKSVGCLCVSLTHYWGELVVQLKMVIERLGQLVVQLKMVIERLGELVVQLKMVIERLGELVWGKKWQTKANYHFPGTYWST